MSKNKQKIRSILYLICAFIIFTPLITNAGIPFLGKIEGTGADATIKAGKAFEDLDATAKGMNYSIGTPQDIIKVRMNLTITIVQYLFGFLGIIFLILIIVGGYQWMTAEGNEEIIAKAKKKIINAVIGLIIVLTAYIIVSFIFSTFFDATIARIQS